VFVVEKNAYREYDCVGEQKERFIAASQLKRRGITEGL
jgi:hypothetical protein